MIIVITTLGLTTSELNSGNDTYATGSRPPIAFRTVGETTTTRSYRDRSERSVPGPGPIYVDEIKPNLIGTASQSESDHDFEHHDAAV